MDVLDALRTRAQSQREDRILRFFRDAFLRYEFADSPYLLLEQTYTDDALAAYRLSVDRPLAFRHCGSGSTVHLDCTSGSGIVTSESRSLTDEALILLPNGRALWMRREDDPALPGIMTVLGRCEDGRWEGCTFGDLHYNGRRYVPRGRTILVESVYKELPASFLGACRLARFFEQYRQGEFVMTSDRKPHDAHDEDIRAARRQRPRPEVRVLRFPKILYEPRGGHHRSSPKRPHNRDPYVKTLRAERWGPKRGTQVPVRAAKIHGGTPTEPIREVHISVERE